MALESEFLQKEIERARFGLEAIDRHIAVLYAEIRRSVNYSVALKLWGELEREQSRRKALQYWLAAKIEFPTTCKEI